MVVLKLSTKGFDDDFGTNRSSKIGCGKLFLERYPQQNPANIHYGFWYAVVDERE